VRKQNDNFFLITIDSFRQWRVNVLYVQQCIYVNIILNM
jgi:hypothetical protein